MTPEDPRPGKWITPDRSRKGVFIVDGKKFENPVKRVHIPAYMLDDLTSLAIQAFAGEFEDSFGQSYLDDAMNKLRKKYPGEQPQEVWRRDIARAATLAIEAEDLAGGLITRNPGLMTSINLDSISDEAREKALNLVADKIKEYWPSASQRG